MSKPGTVPTWDTNLTLVTTPPAGVLSDGMAVNDRLPAQYLNWVLGHLTKWAVYLNALEGESLTWTGVQTYQNANEDTSPIVSAEPTGRRAFAQLELRGTTAKAIFYAGLEFELVINATWSNGGSLWTQTDSANPSLRLAFSPTTGTIHLDYKSSSAAAWADNAWTSTQVSIAGATGNITAAGNIQASGAGKSLFTSDGPIVAGDGASHLGRLAAGTAKSGTTVATPSIALGDVWKDTPALAWCRCSVAGAALTFVRGLNIQSATRIGAGVYDITLSVGAPNHLVPVVTAYAGSLRPIVAQISSSVAITTTVLRVACWDVLAAGVADPDGFFVAVFGG